MKNEFVLAIDQGTSSTKTIVFDGQGRVLAKGSVPLKTWYLEGGFVEQEPEAIWQNVLDSVKECLSAFVAGGYDLSDIQTCGISNQRETFVVWDENGKPLHNAVVWQCKRSISVCADLKAKGLEPEVQQKTGLIVDPYFSGTKMIWLYENNAEIKTAVDAGKAYFGNVDTWLLYKMTSGKAYLTDYTNASRTLFLNLNTLQWDKELLAKFGLQNLNLPELKPSSSRFGETDFEGLLKQSINIDAMIGDSHAAAFGEGCFDTGTAKATLGTGCSILMNIGSEAKASQNGMMTTICWATEDRVDYAFEGVIVSCGATMEWLKNELGILADTQSSEAMALSVQDNNGVYLVPAFSGMGAPHWDMSRKAAIYGLTFDCNKNHIVRAGLESIAYQIKDVVNAMQRDAGIELKELMVNGGITSNTFVLRLIADLLNCNLVNRGIADVSALGAALLAGLTAKIYPDIDHLKTLSGNPVKYHPDEFNQAVKDVYKGWQKLFQ